MPVTPVTIEPRPTTAAAQPKPPRQVVVVADVDSLTDTNQRGCGNDNPYN
jgi:hypothetical protein